MTLFVNGSVNMQMIINRQIYSAGILEHAFDSSGADLTESNVVLWCRCDKKYHTKIQLVRLIESLASRLHLDANDITLHSIYDCKKNLYESVSYSTPYTNGTQLYLKTQSVKGDPSATYIIATMSYSTNKNIKAKPTLGLMIDKLMESLPSRNREIQVTHTLSGSFRQIVSARQRNAIIRCVFRSLGCVPAESMADNGYVNIIAYAPGLSNEVQLRRKRINVNLAMRDDITKKRTILSLASPIILGEY
jgi:hypothetical protein